MYATNLPRRPYRIHEYQGDPTTTTQDRIAVVVRAKKKNKGVGVGRGGGRGQLKGTRLDFSKGGGGNRPGHT